MIKHDYRHKNFLQSDSDTLRKVVLYHSGLLNVVVGGVLDVADSYRRDAVELLKATRHRKSNNTYYNYGQVAMYARRTEGIYKKLWRVLVENIGGEKDRRYGLYLDIMDEIGASVRADVTKLYYPVKNILDKHGIEDSALKARIEVTALLNILAYKAFEANCFAVKAKTGHDVTKFFAKASPMPMARMWEHLADIVCDYPKEIRDEISNDSNCTLALVVLAKKLAEESYVEEVMSRVVAQHPEVTDDDFVHYDD